MAKSEWQTDPNAPIEPGEWFLLWNVEAAKYLAYGKREYGINLKWYKRQNRPQPNFTVSRRDGISGPIKYGELVALREKTGGFLYYEEREYGINLRRSSRPVYEWEIRGGPSGETVKRGKLGDNPTYITETLIRLYNGKAKADVVYGKRRYGINLVWDKS